MSAPKRDEDALCSLAEATENLRKGNLRLASFLGEKKTTTDLLVGGELDVPIDAVTKQAREFWDKKEAEAKAEALLTPAQLRALRAKRRSSAPPPPKGSR